MNEANRSITEREIHRDTVLAARLAPDPALTPEALDQFVFDRGFPLTAAGVTTFAYRGAADSVRLVHFGIGLPEDLGFERLGGSNWWMLALSLPDGTRLEVVADRELRRTLRERWHELEGFVDPLSRLKPRQHSAPIVGNLRDGIPARLPDELITVLAAAPGVRVERIVSRGHRSPATGWYDQEQSELVLVVEGAARIEFPDDDPVDIWGDLSDLLRCGYTKTDYERQRSYPSYSFHIFFHVDDPRPRGPRDPRD